MILGVFPVHFKFALGALKLLAFTLGLSIGHDRVSAAWASVLIGHGPKGILTIGIVGTAVEKLTIAAFLFGEFAYLTFGTNNRKGKR